MGEFFNHPFQSAEIAVLERVGFSITRSNLRKLRFWNGSVSRSTHSKTTKQQKWNGLSHNPPIPKPQNNKNGTGSPKSHPFQKSQTTKMEWVLAKATRSKKAKQQKWNGCSPKPPIPKSSNCQNGMG